MGNIFEEVLAKPHEFAKAEEARAAQRRPRALFVEETIVAMRPEYCQGDGLVDALMLGFENRYGENESLLQAARDFKKAIDRADRALPRGEE